MRRILLAAMMAMFFSATALAKEPRLLHEGEFLQVEEGDLLSIYELRRILRDRGYKRLGTGGEYGHILVTTAQGPDRNRYEIKVHGRTGEVLRHWALRKLY